MKMRKLSLLFLGFASLVANYATAATPQPFRTGPAVEYVLKVNEPQVLANQFLWTIKAVCKISCENESNLIAFKVLRKSGSFNGSQLSAGDSMEVLVHPHDKLYITAFSGAQVELVNLGEQTVTAECSVA